MHKFDVVTGAFGYTGKYITRRLLSAGRRVRTLTGHPDRENPFGRDVEVAPLDFAHPEALANSLRGADVLFNTYWVRFNHGRASFDDAVRNSAALIHAARKAGFNAVILSPTGRTKDHFRLLPLPPGPRIDRPNCLVVTA